MLKGITVKLYNRTKTGTDAFNHPIYSETSVDVNNVLVSPSTSTDIKTSVDLVGKKAQYTLGIPKGDTHVWENRVVEFFGHKYKTYAFVIEGIEELVPGQWHKKVMCERYE